MLEVINASKTFAKGTPNEHKALDHLNLSLKEGEFVTILGSNGAGKSTLFNAICGYFLLDEGSVILDGKNISYLPEHQRSASIGRLFQDPMKGTAPNLTIQENLALAYSKNTKGLFRFAITKKDREMFCEALKRFDMGLEDRMATKIGLLSGGQRQVVTLLMSTIVTPKLLLLDEPAAGMNPQETEELTAFIGEIREKFKITILLIEHHMNLVMGISDRIYVLDFGKLIAHGTPAEIQKNQRVIDAYLGVADDA